MNQAHSPTPRSALRTTLWSFRGAFLSVGGYSLVANLLMLSPTLYMLQVYDRVLQSQSELTLLAMSMLTLAMFAVMAAAEWMRSRLLVRAGVALDARLSTQVFNASFDAYLNQTGNSPSRAFSDLIQVRQFLTGNGIFAFFDAPWTPIYMAVLFFLHPMLGWLGIVFALVQLALAKFGHQGTLAPSEAATAANTDAGIFLQSKLRNAEVIESMGMLRNLQRRWLQRHDFAMQRSGQAQHVSHRITAISKFVRYSQQSLVLGAGALLVIQGELSPGGMIAANVLMTRALAPIDLMVSSWRQFAGMRAAFERLEKLLADYPERDHRLQRVAPSGAIHLQNAVATAPGRKEAILKDVSVSALPGSVTVILGPSGSGKSTLARVMVGIWPDVSGNVLLDELPIASWNREELGPHIGYLPQDVELFEGTIAENIARFGSSNSAPIIEAAKAAGLHEMILRFPKGYDTSTGEAGNLLSGGQRQRLGLARAIYGNPKLVVLDEPNANLDDAGEAALQQTVVRLKAQGKTVVLITHRPGAVAVADHLLILNNGQVQARGPRDAVIAALQAAQKNAAAAAPSAALPA